MLRSARPAQLLLLLSMMILALLCGCSDSTAPPDAQDNVLDPGDSSFALKDLSVPVPWGPPVLLRLEGANFTADPADGTVSLDVRVVNLSDRTVGSPLTVWLSGFSPADVAPINAAVAIIYGSRCVRSCAAAAGVTNMASISAMPTVCSEVTMVTAISTSSK